jgi:hypothetical protein
MKNTSQPLIVTYACRGAGRVRRESGVRWRASARSAAAGREQAESREVKRLNGEGVTQLTVSMSDTSVDGKSIGALIAPQRR